MPELPEVETVRRGLLPLIGAQIVGAQFFHARTTRHHPATGEAVAAELVGSVIVAAVRRGKYLWFPLQGSDASNLAANPVTALGDWTPPSTVAPLNPSAPPSQALLAHLGMSGQLLLRLPKLQAACKSPSLAAPSSSGEPCQPIDAEPQTNDPHLRARLLLQLSDGQLAELDFIDQRTFGYLHPTAMYPTPESLPGGVGSELHLLPARVAHIGRDVLDPHLDIATVTESFQRSSAEVKRLLLDQAKLSGIGNIYADEALWRAHIHPAIRGRDLPSDQIANLIYAAVEVIERSLNLGGTSFDALYVNAAGVPGQFQSELAVYGRESQPCPRCGTLVERIKLGGRSTHFCPNCQPVA
jgi:formamidopyrimidine-DNA glycosylase